MKFHANLREFTFEKKDTVWKCKLEDYSLEQISPVRKARNRDYFGNSRGESGNSPVESPDGKYMAYIKNYNVFLRKKNGGKEKQLSFDGSEGELYSSHIIWSPDSRFFTTNKVGENKKQYIHFVESSPDKQLQPILHDREYLKPGDALPIKQPALFNVEKGEKIELDIDPFLHQYTITNVRWQSDSQAFTFEFNQRGHQAYQVVKVDAHTGGIKVIVDERSNTFIDYSGKRYRYDLEKTREMIWASERDGWNHIYLIDTQTGAIKNQITKGNWVVRGVEYVDEENREIIFTGSGRNQSEDPYFVHYYRVKFNGDNLKDLTVEKMQHEAVFSKDYKYFTDTYSAPDTPPITVLRQSSNGKELMQLEKVDISMLKEKGWQATEPFMVKGREDKTDIWGNIYRPGNFDPEKSYALIEYIYAGPHSSFVQKSLKAYMGSFSSLAELGFIVVQIDGMGTSNRSKAFQDVCYKNLKDAGLPDRIKWIKAAAEKYPYIYFTSAHFWWFCRGSKLNGCPSVSSGILFCPLCCLWLP